MKKLSIMLACLALAGMLGGCGTSFDAAGYTKAILDNSYRNDSSDFVKMRIGTSVEASELYEEGLRAQVNALLASVDATQEQEEQYRELVADILAEAKYTVGEAVKQDDNSYLVEVSCERMNIFTKATEDYLERYEMKYAEWMAEEDTPTEAEITDWYIVTLKDCLAASLATAAYDEPETITIRIEPINKLYTPNKEDLANLGSALFDN